jgi:hypothetical protein
MHFERYSALMIEVAQSRVIAENLLLLQLLLSATAAAIAATVVCY